MSPVKIFIGNIAIGSTTQELRDLFAQYGQVTECDVLGAGNYAFVHMASEAEGELAIQELNGCILNGSVLNVEKSTSATQGRRRKEFQSSSGGGPRPGGGEGSRRGIPKRSTTKIFIGNLKDGTTNEELQAIFEPYGSVAEADVVSGFGFVHMDSQSEAIKAIKALNGSYLSGNRINVELSTEATQGRSRESLEISGGGFPVAGEFPPRGRPLARFSGRGHPLTAGKRYDPYGKMPLGVPFHRGLYPATDSFASTSYGSGYTPMYGISDYASDPYAMAPAAPVLGSRVPLAAPAAATASSSTDSFARQLLNLYIKDPSTFDKFAKNPLVQQSLDLNAAQDEEDPYYRPPREYYEAKSAASTSSLRETGLDDPYGAGDSYAAFAKRPSLLPFGSSRGLAGAGLPPMPLSLFGGAPLLGPRPLGAPVMRARLPPPRPGNLYTSFDFHRKLLIGGMKQGRQM